ncbi:hypothetical protein CC79DRAFT_1369800 [Sarocladium strictum]
MALPPPSPEQLEAIMASTHRFNVEAFTLLGVALAVTGLRLYARISSVGFKGLWADDYLVTVAAILYSAETALAYSVGNYAQGLANNSMTPYSRANLPAEHPEYQMRILGSKIQLAGWSVYSTLLWCLKGAMCTFYFRLTRDFEGYRPRLYVGFGLIGVTYLVVVMNFFLSCRPFHHMWQISPDPGQFCYPAISPALVWVYLSFNVLTDLYLIAIPMPMLFRAAMPWWKRAWLVGLFSLGLFVVMAAILRVVLLVSDPINGAQLAGSWAVRETFVAVVTTNLPLLFPHVKKVASPVLSIISTKLGCSSGRATGEESSGDPTTLDSWRGKKSQGSRTTSSNPMSDARCNESEERIVDDVALEQLSQKESSTSNGGRRRSTDEEAALPAIQREVEISIQPQEEFEAQRQKARAQGSAYTHIWSGNKVDADDNDRR